MQSLTGKWKGFYLQQPSTTEGEFDIRQEFEIELVEKDEEFTGICEDLEVVTGKREKSSIKGFRDGNFISFILQYENHVIYDRETFETSIVPESKHPEIHYWGTFDPAARKYSGAWEMENEFEYEGKLVKELDAGEWEMWRV